MVKDSRRTVAEPESPAVHSGRKRLKIAVVGTGISGLSAAWLLDQHHNVTVYEQNRYVGGHSNTASIEIEGQQVAVDTGFIVYNPVNYPNLVALFEHLGVLTKVSDMSFSASLNDGTLEYSGTNLRGLFAQPLNILRPRFVRMLRDIYKFYTQAPQFTGDESLRDISLRDFLRNRNFSDAFIYDHLMPMGAAIWSSSVQQMLEFPALSFLRFFDNHGLLQFRNRPQWRTVEGGSRAYIEKLTATFADHIRVGQSVTAVNRGEQYHTVICADGSAEEYDHVMLACHADQALHLLSHPTEEEDAVLGSIEYQKNTVILHSDTSLLPMRKRAWASWNYIGSGTDNQNQQLSVTYLMNRLQGLSVKTPIMVTLNPVKEIDPDKVFQCYEYEHPLFNVAAIRSQPRLWSLQGRLNTWFCGAYFGSGFHEDGIQAGLAVAERLGGFKRPWHVINPSTRIGLCEEGHPLETVGVIPP